MISSNDADVKSNTVSGSRIGLVVTSLGASQPAIEDDVIEVERDGHQPRSRDDGEARAATGCATTGSILRVFGDNPTTLDGNEVLRLRSSDSARGRSRGDPETKSGPGA